MAVTQVEWLTMLLWTVVVLCVGTSGAAIAGPSTGGAGLYDMYCIVAQVVETKLLTKLHVATYPLTCTTT
jgi:hypothetical protein